MRKKNLIHAILTISLLLLFCLYTLALMSVDVRPVGPRASSVGFASINTSIHSFFGVSMLLYEITDWLGLVAILVALGFAVLGLVQWIRRKNILLVDSSILTLGGFYLLVISMYVFFEYHVVNYRPVLIDNFLEASYPSSTTMLIMCIVPTAMLQFHRLIHNRTARSAMNVTAGGFAVFMVVGRMLSGVHWFTDILGSLLLSAGLVMLYHTVCGFVASRQKTSANVAWKEK